jgi:hypothetical protein
MSAGEIAMAAAWFVIFGGLALAMGRSALGDWRQGRRGRDGVALLSAVQQWVPTAVAATVAVFVPIALLTSA